MKALAEALNGLLSVSISGLRQAAEDCCKLIKNAEQKLDELTKTASEYLELVKADGNRLETVFKNVWSQCGSSAKTYATY